MKTTCWSSNRASEWEERGFKWLILLGFYWDLLGFSRTTIWVYREWSEKEKISSERQLCGWKCLVDVRGQRRMGRLVRDDRKASIVQITTRYNQGNAEYHLWTHNASNPEANGLQQQKTTPVSLLSAKNRTRRLQFAQNISHLLVVIMHILMPYST